MSKNSKTILKYPQFQETIHNYLSMNEFKAKADETIRGHRVTVIGFCNYLGDSGINDFSSCTQSHAAEFIESISNLSTSTRSGKTFRLRCFFNYLYNEKITLFSGNELFPVFCKYFLEKIAEVFGHYCMSILDNVAAVSGRHQLTTRFHCRH